MSDASSASARRLVQTPPSRLHDFWHSFAENRGAVFGLVIFLAFLLVAIFAPLLAPYAPNAQFRDHLLQPPVWEAGGSWEFPLGTDPLGRDMLSRLIHGARFSFFIGVVVVGIASFFGVIVGVISG